MVPSQHTRARLRSKAKLAIPHFLVLIAGLAYFITTFMVAGTGFDAVSRNLHTRLRDASVELRAQGNVKYRENILESQLDKLLRTQLSSKFMETYEDCLARGMLQGNDKFFGLDFHYSTFRDQTIDWTTENCGRLHHAPQIVQATPQQDVLTHWARISYRSRRLVQKVFKTITGSAKPLQVWLFNKTGVGFFKPSVSVVPTALQLLTCATLPARKLLPTGFDLYGSTSPCRLVYVHTEGSSANRATISEEALAESKRKVQELFRIHHYADGLRRATATIIKWLMRLELLCFMVYFVSMYTSWCGMSLPSHGRRDIVSCTILVSRCLTKQERHAAVCTIVQLAAIIASASMERAYERAFLIGRVTILDIGVWLITYSIPLSVDAFVPATDITDGPQMYKAIKQLYRIARQPDALAIKAKIPLSCTKASHNIGKITSITGPSVEDNDRLHEPTFTAVFLQADAPTPDQPTSCEKILEEELRNGTLPTNRGYNAWADPDTDSESSDDGYVALAGSVSPTITEELDWSVVDTWIWPCQG
jgi:hypothetical protein